MLYVPLPDANTRKKIFEVKFIIIPSVREWCSLVEGVIKPYVHVLCTLKICDQACKNQYVSANDTQVIFLLISSVMNVVSCFCKLQESPLNSVVMIKILLH